MMMKKRITAWLLFLAVLAGAAMPGGARAEKLWLLGYPIDEFYDPAATQGMETRLPGPAEWTEEAGGWVFTIRSNRFLRNMVRSVTGTLLDVGRGKLSIEGLREIIENKDRCAAGTSMPACGLFLTKVEYPEGVLSFKF